MANEITLNPYDEAEGEFNADELESLEIGETLAQAENQLLAGKYRSAEELERGYLELQKRMSGKEDTEEEASNTQEGDDTQQNEEAPSEGLYEALVSSYQKGEWDPKLVEQVESMHPVDVLNLMLENNQPATPELTDSDISQVQESVGGPEAYGQMIQWAGQNLSEGEINLYDKAMDSGDPLTIFFAAQALYGRFQDAVGYDGELLTGTAPQAQSKGFRSQAELVAAMSDPRYDKDPAYRQDIADKLAISNI